MPNPNAGSLYPIRVLLARIPFPVALRLYPILHWLAAGIGMLVLCTALGRSVSAAWVAAVTYVFSGVSISEVFFPHIQPGMTLLPWIVWTVQRPGMRRLPRVLLLGWLFALDFLAADVFTIALGIVFAVAWIALEESPAVQWPRAAEVAAATVLGALAAAPQIVATALWIPQTQRAVLGIPLSEVLFFSIHPWRLLELVIPFPFGPAWHLAMRDLWGYKLFHGRPMGLFVTLYAGAFAVIALFSAWRARERGVRFARVAWIAGLAVSVTPAFLPAAWQTHTSPLPLRNPEKFAVALVFALALFASIGWDAWSRRPRRLRVCLGIGVLLAALASASALRPDGAGRVAVAALRDGSALAARPARTLPGSLAEAGLLWMATVVALDALGWKNRRAGVGVSVVLLTAVPILANRRIGQSLREDFLFRPPPFARLQQREDPDGFYRAVDETLFRPDSKLAASQYQGAISDVGFTLRNWFAQTPLLFGRGTVVNSDFDAGDLSRVDSLRRLAGVASGFRDSDALFGSLALKWGIRFRDQPALAGFQEIGGDALQAWDRHAAALPDIRWIERWVEAPSALAGMRALPQLASGEVVIESGVSRRGQTAPGTVRVLQRSANRLELAVDSPAGGWLFVLRAFWPYRTIRLDGKTVDAFPAQLAYCAVPIPPGPHRLTWQEEVPGLEVSRFGPILFGAFSVAGLGIVGFRRRKP